MEEKTRKTKLCPVCHREVARAGGAAWIFLLSNIVLMPVVIPVMKRRLGA